MTKEYKHTPGPVDFDRGIEDRFNPGSGHYQTQDDFLTVYIGEDDFNPETSNYALVHGPQQEANARLLSSAYNAFDKAAEKLGINAVALAQRMEDGGLADMLEALKSFIALKPLTDGAFEGWEDAKLAGLKAQAAIAKFYGTQQDGAQ